MIRYKLTDENLQTHNGFQWEFGKKEVIENPGTEMCSRQVFHYYASPEQAVLLNPIHANFRTPRLFEVEIDEEVAFDGLKGGCHEMTLVRELEIPVITPEQKVKFAIKTALTVYKNEVFISWAEKWLSGEDRTADAAYAAAYASRSAYAAADAADAADAATRVTGAIDFQSIIEEVLSC